MLLLKDKYTPKNLEDFIINNDIAKSLLNLSKDSNSSEKNIFLNIIFNGQRSVGKYTLAKAFLCDIFGEGVYKTRKATFKVKTKEIEIVQSSFHYEIILTPYFLNDKQTFNNLIVELSENVNISTLSQNIFLIKNVELLDKETIVSFKKIMEKFFGSAIFVMTSANGSKIRQLQSNCTFIRVPTPKKNEIISFLKEKTLIPIDNTENLSIINENNSLEVIFSKIEMKIIGVSKSKISNNLLEEHLELILKYVYSLKANNIIKIREEIYFIICKNFDKNSIFKFIVDKTSNNKKISTQKKIDILDSATKFQHRMTKSYREVIHLEAFLIDVMNILST